MTGVSRETEHFSWSTIEAARKRFRKVDPARFALLWLEGVRGPELRRIFGISPSYASDLARRFRLPPRKGGRPRKPADAGVTHA